MAQVGARKVGDGREERHHRQPQLVRHFDRAVQRRVVDTPLGSLHPVDDAFRVGRGNPASPDEYTRSIRQLAQRLRQTTDVIGGTCHRS